MPLVAQPPGVERERVACIARFGHRAIVVVDKPCPSVRCREQAVAVQPRLARHLACAQRPLLRAAVFQHGITHTGDVQVAPAGACAVFVPDRLGVGVVEQAGPILHCYLPLLQPAREIDRDRPVGARLARRADRRPHAADAPFAVGDRALLLAPGCRRQQQVGVRGGGRRGKGVLQHHQLGALQRAAHGGLVGHRLRRIGAADPQGLDLAVRGGLEHVHRHPARPFGDCGHPP